MFWDVAGTVVCVLLVLAGAGSLTYLLKQRQASDRSYGGENDTGRGRTG
jgi:hypothetical protein